MTNFSRWFGMVNNDAITIVPVKSHAKKKWNKKLVFSELGLVLFLERIMSVASNGNTEALQSNHLTVMKWLEYCVTGQ